MAPRQSEKNQSVIVLAVGIVISIILGGAHEAFTVEKAYPTKEINMYVGFPPGGGGDTTARGMSQLMEKLLGVPIVVINKPGASSAIATTYVANAEPDGYTLLFALTPYPIMAKIEEPSLTYGVQNLTFLGASHKAHVFLTVGSKSPWKTYEEFVRYAKNNPVKFASVGGVSPEGMQQAHFAKFAGFKRMIQIPYTGASQKANALLGGEVDADLAIVPAANFVKSGDLRWLVIFAPERHPFHPEVPAITEKEKGFDVFVTYRSTMIGPKGLPRDVINKLTKAFKDAANSEKGKVMFKNVVYMPDYKTPEECVELWKLDENLYKK